MYYLLGKLFPGQPKNHTPLIYCCYRHGFHDIDGFTDDVGWGCTIRSFQMLLGNCLSEKMGYQDAKHYVKDEGVLSFASIAKKGIKFQREIGEWFKPSETAKCIRDIFVDASLRSTVGFDFFIYGRDEVQSVQFPALMVFPTKLGVDEIDGSFHSVVVDMLRDSRSMGIVSGSGSSSYFLVGVSDADKILYLDPHEVRRYDDPSYDHRKIHSCKINTLNPSVAVAFFLQDFPALQDVTSKFETIFSTVDLSEDTKQFSCVETMDEDDFCVIVEEISTGTS